MSTSATIIPVSQDWSVSVDQGCIEILQNGVSVGQPGLAGKALIAGLYELAERRDTARTLRGQLPEDTLVTFAAPAAQTVLIEGGKYDIRPGHSPQETSILRHGRPWIAAGALDHAELWFELAFALDTEHRRVVALGTAVADHQQIVQTPVIQPAVA